MATYTMTLSAEEAIARIGGDLRPETIREWARAGRIGSVKVGRERRFLPDHIDEFIRSNTSEATESGRSTRSRRRRKARA